MNKPIAINKNAYRAEITVACDSHIATFEKSNGYAEKVEIEGGVLLKITVSAPTLEDLKMKLGKHIDLV